jgi:flagellar motor protein MotB
MDVNFILDMVIGQIGAEATKDLKEKIVMLMGQMKEEQIFVLKKLKGKGVCLIITNSNEFKTSFPNLKDGYKPTIIELEKTVNNVEI